jgi:hypothetical protein
MLNIRKNRQQENLMDASIFGLIVFFIVIITLMMMVGVLVMMDTVAVEMHTDDTTTKLPRVE